MSNFKNKQEFIRIYYTPSSAVTAGDVIIQNGLVGYATDDIAANTLGTIVVMGLATVPKTAGVIIAAGKDVYWDASAEVVTETVGSNSYLGKATLAAASADTTATVLVMQAPYSSWES